jgi:hypothetical protein
VEGEDAETEWSREQALYSSVKPTIEIGRLCEGSYLAWYRSICFILSCTGDMPG